MTRISRLDPGRTPTGDEKGAFVQNGGTVWLTIDQILGLGVPSPGIAIKAPVVVATAGNITLSGLQTVNGVVLAAGNRVLVWQQTDPAQNGIYNAGLHAWTRSIDFNRDDMIASGLQVLAVNGTTNSNTVFQLTSADPLSIGTSALAFAFFANLSAISSQADAEAGLRNDVLMTPLRVGQEVTARIASQAAAVAGTDNTALMTPLRAQQQIVANGTAANFVQPEAGAATRSVLQVLREWHTLTMYGGIGDGNASNSATNAAACIAARNALRNGGTLTIPPGNFVCDPVVWVDSGTANYSMTIEGVSNPSAGAATNSMITCIASGSQKFWNFDSPATGANNGVGMSVKNLYFEATDSGFTGTLVSSTTTITNGSRITSEFLIENCNLLQIGTGACTLLDIGKAIEASVHHCNFSGGATQILGQQGQAVAGIAQARQSVAVDIRKCGFINCNGYPILYGGEAWGLRDNAFEYSLGGRGRAFLTTANWPVNGMTWENNWFGDTSVVGDQWIVVYGNTFIFRGNVMGGAYTSGATGMEGINLNSVEGFDIDCNSYSYLSVFISSSGVATNYGSIVNNRGNTIGATTSGSSNFGANVRIENNKT